MASLVKFTPLVPRIGARPAALRRCAQRPHSPFGLRRKDLHKVDHSYSAQNGTRLDKDINRACFIARTEEEISPWTVAKITGEGSFD